MNNRARLTLICALTTVGACSTTTPIGEVPAGTSGTPTGAGGTGAGGTGAAGTGAPMGPYVPSGNAVLNDPPFTNPSGISGDWVGYLENYDLYFTDSDVLKVHFGVDAQGNGTITVVQGTGTPPAPATDAFQAWPVAAIDDQGNPGLGLSYPSMPLSGFTYTAHGVTWQGKRLKFHRLGAQPWESWCALQRSYPFPGSDSAWSCNGGNTATFGGNTCHFNDGDTTAPCTRNHQYMCAPDRFCACNATGCGVTTSSPTFFDISFFADHAIGSMDAYHLILNPPTP